MTVLLDCCTANHINVIPSAWAERRRWYIKLRCVEMIVACSERQLWRRVAASFVVVSLLLLIGKFLPVPGITGEAIAEIMAVCQAGHGGYIGFPVIYVCHGPMLPHKELLATPLLGSFAIVLFFAIWLRQRLTNDSQR